MFRHRVLVVLAGIGLAVSALAGTAWAHPELEPFAPATGAVLSDSAGHRPEPATPSPPSSHAAPRDHLPEAVSLVAGGLTFLAALRNRRRTLALALILLVTTAAFEGVAHAALRLANVRHADTLSIGASVIPPVLVEGDAAPLGSSPLARVGQAPEHQDSQVTDAAVAFAKERAPPVSAAS